MKKEIFVAEKLIQETSRDHIKLICADAWSYYTMTTSPSRAPERRRLPPFCSRASGELFTTHVFPQTEAASLRSVQPSLHVPFAFGIKRHTLVCHPSGRDA